jgi:hypothetical protein
VNIALPAVVVLLFILPGLILLRVRKKPTHGVSYIPPEPKALSSEAALAICYAILFHVVYYMLANVCLGGLARFSSQFRDVEIQPNAVMMLLMGKYGPADEHFDWTLNALTTHPFLISIYFLGLYGLAALVAYWKGEWWDNYLSSKGIYPTHETRVREWKEFFENQEKEGFDTLATVVVEMAGNAYLFMGIVHKIYFSQTTRELDRLVLVRTSKKLIDPGNPNTPITEVFGEKFAIAISELKTINVLYFKEELLSAEEGSQAIAAQEQE